MQIVHTWLAKRARVLLEQIVHEPVKQVIDQIVLVPKIIPQRQIGPISFADL